MDVQVNGWRAFQRLAADCKDAARKDLERELRRGLSGSTAPMRTAIRAAAAATMPSAGGYAAVLPSALRVTPRQSGLLLRLTVAAKGAGEDRDVRALDAGRLRHPVYGRSRRGRGGRRVPSPWAVTAIRPGFVTDTFDKTADAVLERLGEAVQTVADKIAGG